MNINILRTEENAHLTDEQILADYQAQMAEQAYHAEQAEMASLELLEGEGTEDF